MPGVPGPDASQRCRLSTASPHWSPPVLPARIGQHPSGPTGPEQDKMHAPCHTVHACHSGSERYKDCAQSSLSATKASRYDLAWDRICLNSMAPLLRCLRLDGRPATSGDPPGATVGPVRLKRCTQSVSVQKSQEISQVMQCPVSNGAGLQTALPDGIQQVPCSSLDWILQCA